MSVIRCLVCVVILAVSAFAANQADPQPDAPANPAYPNIVLITVDTTRADRMGFLGSKRGLTPNLDALAKQSCVFTHAYSQAPLTPTSHATILTGVFPQFHQVVTFLIPLAKDMPFMPDILKSRGYSTAAFIGSVALDRAGAPGFARGFDMYDADYSWDKYSPSNRYHSTERRGGEVVASALKWLKAHPQRPFFIWIHLYDPHDPYDPPEPYKTRYAKAPYDGEIAYADSALGNLFRQLKADGLYDGAMIAMTADHGEALGAHGEDRHGIFLYDETIHVPLLIKLPNGGSAGKRVETQVELADIMPTVLQAAGVEVPEKVQGQSLLGFLEPGTRAGDAAAKAWRDRGAYSQADYGHVAFAWSAIQSLRTGKYLYVQAPRPELYDDLADPKAEHSLVAAAPAVADTLSARLEDFRKKTTNTQETPKSIMDTANSDKLAALGYVSRRTESPVLAPGQIAADPKDKIGTVNVVHRINEILHDWRCDKAVPALHKAIAKDPSIAMLHFFLGGCYMEYKDYAKAAPELRRAVQIDPGFSHAEMNLGRALLNLQDYEAAATAFEHVEVLEPHTLDVAVFLEVVYAQLGRVQDEIRECRKVLASEPKHFGSNLNLGRFLAQTGDTEGAIASLQKASLIRPKAPMPHAYLSDIYSQMGRADDAKRERDEADRLGAFRGHSQETMPDADEPQPK